MIYGVLTVTGFQKVLKVVEAESFQEAEAKVVSSLGDYPLCCDVIVYELEMPKGLIVVNEEEYQEAIRDQGKLNALYEYGVNDWDGYSMAMNEWRKRENK